MRVTLTTHDTKQQSSFLLHLRKLRYGLITEKRLPGVQCIKGVGGSVLVCHSPHVASPIQGLLCCMGVVGEARSGAADGRQEGAGEGEQHEGETSR